MPGLKKEKFMFEKNTVLRARIFHTGGTVAMDPGADKKSVIMNTEFQERMGPILERSANGLKSLLSVDIDYKHCFISAEDSSNLRMHNINSMHRMVMETQLSCRSLRNLVTIDSHSRSSSSGL